MRFDAVLFDVDGTLIHSSPGILSTLRSTFEQMGVDTAGVDLGKYLGPPLRRSFAEHLPTSEQVEQAVLLYRRLYHEKGQYDCTLFPGVRGMLAALQGQGVCLCTATSKPVQVVRPMLEHLGIAPFFTMVGGAALDSSLDTKTAVMRYVLCQPFLQGKRVLMVGDRRDDMQGAADCGVPAAAVLYGYGSRGELEPFHPSFFAPDCASLTNYILG